MEPLTVTIDDNTVRYAVQPRDDATVELRRPRIDRNHVALPGLADRHHILIEQTRENAPRGLARATNDKAICRGSPVMLEPIRVRL